MSAESAVMGLRRGWLGMAMSMMTTLFCGEVSRTQMYLSDSMVTWVKVMNCGAIPRLVSVRASRMAMGALAAAMAAGSGGERTLSDGGLGRVPSPPGRCEREIGSDLRTGGGGTNGAEKMDGIFRACTVISSQLSVTKTI